MATCGYIGLVWGGREEAVLGPANSPGGCQGAGPGGFEGGGEQREEHH